VAPDPFEEQEARAPVGTPAKTGFYDLGNEAPPASRLADAFSGLSLVI
jgi:hypothetical protein